MNKKYNVAIVGATGLIGRKFIEVLERRNFPVKKIRLFASPKSEGKYLTAFGKRIGVEKLDENSFGGIDVAFFSAGKEISLKYAPIAKKRGAVVIDNSSAFRQNDEIPLIVPEINGDTLKNYEGKIIANPNCSTAIATLPLEKLNRLFRLKRVIYTTFQAVSGSGNKGILDLENCQKGMQPTFYPTDVSQNCIPLIGDLKEFGYSEEELKMVNETKKIFGRNVEVSATCVRVPIKNCHAISVDAEFEKNFLDEEVREILRSSKGVKICNLPVQSLANGKDNIFVGRIRRNLAFKNGISFYCVGDNTLKGAALNAVQIAEIFFNIK